MLERDLQWFISAEHVLAPPFSRVGAIPDRAVREDDFGEGRATLAPYVENGGVHI